MAIIWILGEYGEHIEDSPYMLENMVKNIDNATDTSKVKHIVFGFLTSHHVINFFFFSY